MSERFEKIIICPCCRGRGTVSVAIWDREGYRDEICPTCAGEKVLKKIVTIEYKRTNQDAEQTEIQISPVALFPMPGRE